MLELKYIFIKNILKYPKTGVTYIILYRYIYIYSFNFALLS